MTSTMSERLPSFHGRGLLEGGVHNLEWGIREPGLTDYEVFEDFVVVEVKAHKHMLF